ncbi:hypothetical protein H312_01114, partial [Anncaliia algerae PRA339]
VDCGWYHFEYEKGIFVEVFSRDSGTFANIVLENIIKGIAIYTDKWKEYSKLNNLRYKHQTVYHSSNIDDSVSGNNK